jgi:hypothetical protein
VAIDDEIDAIRSQYPESQSNLALGLTLKMLSALPGGTGLVIKLAEVRTWIYEIDLFQYISPLSR